MSKDAAEHVRLTLIKFVHPEAKHHLKRNKPNQGYTPPSPQYKFNYHTLNPFSVLFLLSADYSSLE